MPYFIDYLLKVSLGLVVVYLFYKLILSRHTFYTWNRWCLLIYSILAFVIPFIDISPAIEEARYVPSVIVDVVPTLPDFQQTGSTSLLTAAGEPSASPLEIWDILLWIFAAGVAIRVVQICSQLYAFRSIKKRSELIYRDGISIYNLQEDILPFSFCKSIFLNQKAHSEEDRQKIIVHELVHVNQLHSLDILFAELLCTVCWFNPAVWLIRHAIRENLEYIADREVVENGSSVKEYQYLLLKVSGNHMSGMVNYFTFSSLKKRILMMNKAKSARIHLIKFVFLLPLLCVLLLAFRNTNQQFPGKLTDVKKGKFLSKRVIICGILKDYESGEPLRGYDIEVSLDSSSFFVNNSRIVFEKAKPIKIEVVQTDEDGFYYWEEKDRDRLNMTGAGYTYNFKGEEYNEFGGVMGMETDGVGGNVQSTVVYLTKKKSKNGFHDWYGDELREFANSSSGRKEFKSKLMSDLSVFQQEHDLKLNFKKAYKDPSQIVTKFENGYFDQKRDLIGYVGEMKFYLDGQEVTYDKINYNFRFRQPNLVNSNRVEIQERYATKMYYYTSDTNRDAPPSSIVKSKNVEWVDVSKFDMSLLDKESFYLNGFWQVNGVGSNMKPERGEIKRIALLKGKLARYYNKNFEKLWWIETRPAEEVVGRPDFAKL